MAENERTDQKHVHIYNSMAHVTYTMVRKMESKNRQLNTVQNVDMNDTKPSPLSLHAIHVHRYPCTTVLKQE